MSDVVDIYTLPASKMMERLSLRGSFVGAVREILSQLSRDFPSDFFTAHDVAYRLLTHHKQTLPDEFYSRLVDLVSNSLSAMQKLRDVRRAHKNIDGTLKAENPRDLGRKALALRIGFCSVVGGVSADVLVDHAESLKASELTERDGGKVMLNVASKMAFKDLVAVIGKLNALLYNKHLAHLEESSLEAKANAKKLAKFTALAQSMG